MTPEIPDPTRRGYSRWARTQPGCRLAMTFGLPYTLADGAEVNTRSAREFGIDLTQAAAEHFRNR